MIFEIWWNFFYDLFSIKNVADVNNIDSIVSKRNMESVVIMKRFRSNWFEKTKRHHVTYNTRQSVLRRKRIYASFAILLLFLNKKYGPLTFDLYAIVLSLSYYDYIPGVSSASVSTGQNAFP